MAEATFHTDDNGNPSNMRAMCSTSLVAAIACAAATLFITTVESSTGIYLSTMFTVGAFAPKAVQKFAETMPKK